MSFSANKTKHPFAMSKCLATDVISVAFCYFGWHPEEQRNAKSEFRARLAGAGVEGSVDYDPTNYLPLFYP